MASMYRTALGTLFLSAVAFPAVYQPLLTPLWQWLIQNPLYRLSTFETIWTVFLYAVIEVSMTVVFMRNPRWRFAVQAKKHQGDAVNKPHGMRRPSRRWGEAVTYMTPLLLMDLTMIKKFADVPLTAMLESGNYHAAAAAIAANNSTSTYSSTFLVPTLHNMTMSSPLQTQRALPDLPPSSRRVALELAASFFLYDALFFLFHFSLHVIPVVKQWHAPHHRHAEIHPQITNQLHIFERLGLVLLANFSLNIIKSHVFTRTLFVPIFIWLLVELHSGLDLPWGYEKILPNGCGGGARKHSLHHARGGGGYEPYFTWWDILLDRVGHSPKEHVE
jgi:cholesterol 25-hydroxylase